MPGQCGNLFTECRFFIKFFIVGLCMGVATTTDTTDSVRTSFEVFKNLYGMSVQVDKTAKSKKDCKAAVWETFGKATPRIIFYIEQ